MKVYTTPESDIFWAISESNFCVSFDSDDNTEIWIIEDPETI